MWIAISPKYRHTETKSKYPPKLERSLTLSWITKEQVDNTHREKYGSYAEISSEMMKTGFFNYTIALSDYSSGFLQNYESKNMNKSTKRVFDYYSNRGGENRIKTIQDEGSSLDASDWEHDLENVSSGSHGNPVKSMILNYK